MVSETMERPVVTILNIGETLIPCTRSLRVIHAQDVHNHLIYDLYLAIYLGMERNGFSELGIQQCPETRPKCVQEPIVPVEDDGLWYPKMEPHSFKEELGIICHCDVLLADCEDVHL
jgi:hypothetical protein